MKSKLKLLWKNNKSLVVFISLMMVFRSAVADWNDVPTGSMNPTIVEGDRLLVNKMAYDIRVPFTHLSMFKVADPQRSDIIIFDSEFSGKKLVKRVVGLPGDIVAMKNNVLSINGKQLNYQATNKAASPQIATNRKIENVFGNEYFVQIKDEGSSLSSFNPVKVPEGHYLVLGDNRDNSADSRVIGFVPRNEIVGRSRKVVLSLNYDNYYLPRSERFYHTL
jgi:signal peptidase I